MFLLQDPVNSLKALKVVLNCFGEVSGYKVNESKSIIMGMNIDTKIIDTVRSFDPTPWRSTINYL